MYFNAFLTGSVEVCFGGKGKRFMVLDSKIMRRKKTQFIYYRHLKKCNSLFCLGGTSLLFCLFVRSTVSSVENAGAQMTFQNCPVRRGMTCQSTTLASHWPGASSGKGKGGRRGSTPLLWAIRRQFWKLREVRASFLKAQVCPHYLLRVVVGIERDAVGEAASIYLVHYRYSLNGSRFIIILYLLSIYLWVRRALRLLFGKKDEWLSSCHQYAYSLEGGVCSLCFFIQQIFVFAPGDGAKIGPTKPLLSWSLYSNGKLTINK